MKAHNDTVQFEERIEVQIILNAMDIYFEQNRKEKENPVLREFYNKLDMMDMAW